MTAGTDTGSSHTDNITSDNTPDFEVQCTGAGNTITLYVDGAPSGTHTCNGSGTETITSNTITDGNHQITYTETINGVESPTSSPISVEVDTTDPNAPTASTNPNPAKDGDNVTTTVSGVAPGDSVSIPGMTCSPNPSTGGDVTCTGTVGQNGLDGTDNTITITDPAGNTNNSADSGLVVDNTAPTDPTSAPDMTAATDTGLSNSDNITSNNSPSFDLVCTPGNTVNLYVAGNQNGSGTCPASGTISLTPTTPLAEGNNSISYTETDPAGNESGQSPSLNVEVDTTAPNSPVINPNIDTNTSSPVISGSCEAGNVVKLSVNGNPITPTGICDQNGNFNIVPVPGLADGSNSITAVETDPAGNQSQPSQPVVVNTDTSAPNALGAPNVAGAPVTNNNKPVISGSCTDGDIITAQVNGVAITPTATCTNGSYSITPANPILDGVKNISVTATDPSGNISNPSPSTPVTIDTIAPSTPTATTSPNPAANGTAVTTTVSGVAPGDSVSILGMTCIPNPSTGGDVTCTGTAGQSGLDGTNNTITITDPAGNTNTSADTGLSVYQPSSRGSSASRSKPKEYNCKDSRAINFKNTGIHKQSLCIYEEVKEEEVADDKNKKEMVEDESNNNDSLGEGYACPKNM